MIDPEAGEWGWERVMSTRMERFGRADRDWIREMTTEQLREESGIAGQELVDLINCSPQPGTRRRLKRLDAREAYLTAFVTAIDQELEARGEDME
jgi:hypothetical protein